MRDRERYNERKEGWGGVGRAGESARKERVTRRNKETTINLFQDSSDFF